MSETNTNAPRPPTEQLTDEELRAWLDYEYAPTAERVAQLIAAISQCVEAYPEITTDEVLGAFADNAAMVQKLRKEAETTHEREKAPYLRLGRVVDKWLREVVTDRLATPVATVQAMMNAYNLDKLNKSREAARKAAAEAQAEADRKAREAADAVARARSLETTVDAERALRDAETAATAATKAQEFADSKPAEHTRIHGDFGSVTSMAGRWRWRVVDIRKVPVRFLTVVNSLINAELAAAGKDASGKPKGRVDGIEIYLDMNTRVSAKDH